MHKQIKDHSSEIIVVQLLRRVKQVVEKIHLNGVPYDQQVIEYANLIDLLQGFFLVNDSKKINDEKN